MPRHYSKKHLFWLVPVALMLLLLAMLVVVRLLGWHWQGPGWRQGLTLERVWQRSNGCLSLAAHGVRLNGIWPVRLKMDTLSLPACEQTGGGGAGLPSAPPFDITIWALQYQDYPPLQLHVHHRGPRWWAKADLQDSHLHGEYRHDSGQWRLTGQVEGVHLHRRLGGSLGVQGDGVWRPAANTPAKRFHGVLNLLGKQLGLEHQGPRADLTARVAWQGPDWTVSASLGQPMALGGGWVLSPGKGLRGSGHGRAIEKADAALVANGPEGQAVLTLHSDAQRLGRGRGTVTLSGGLAGQVTLNWADQAVTVQPFTLTLQGGVAVALRQAISAPFATEGDTTVPVTVSYREARVHTTDSHLHWRPSDVQWRGALALDGQWHGYRLGGGWRGDIGPTGIHGEPLSATLDDATLHLRARVPVALISAPHWPIKADLDGRFRGLPFTATLAGQRDRDGWGGTLRGHSQLPKMDQGGDLTVNGRWQWRQGWQLLPGTRLQLARSLEGKTLIRPATFIASTPVTVNADGIGGRFQLDARGLVAERWVLPPLTGTLDFSGWRFDAALQVPDWGTRLAATGRDLIGTPRGTLSGRTPLKPALSQGLDVTTRSGTLTLSGRWRGGAKPTLSGRLRGNKVALDWGSINATGLDADLDLSWRGGKARIRSRAPATLAKLDVGTPITDVRLDVDTNLKTWTFNHIQAALLGGRLQAPQLVWPSPRYQTVVLTGIKVAQLAALQSQPVVTLSGAVGGYLPLQLKQDTIAVRDGRLANETPLSLSIPRTDSVKSLEQSNQAVAMALNAINPLRIDDFLAHINMSADGWLDAAVTIKGVNPRRHQLPVVFHYTHRENVLELLRSLRIGDRITNQLMKQTIATPPP